MLSVFPLLTIAKEIIWKSPEGSLEILLGPKWKLDDRTKWKQYSSDPNIPYLPGASYSFYAGGNFPPRNVTLSIIFFKSIGKSMIDSIIKTVSSSIKQQGNEVLNSEYDGKWQGLIFYRFNHSGDPVSQMMIFIETAAGLFILEVNSARKDESILSQECAKIRKSIKILKPFN